MHVMETKKTSERLGPCIGLVRRRMISITRRRKNGEQEQAVLSKMTRKLGEQEKKENRRNLMPTLVLGPQSDRCLYTKRRGGRGC